MSERASLKKSHILMILPAVAWVVIFLFVPLAIVIANSFYTFAHTGVVLPILTLANYEKVLNNTAYVYTILSTLGLGALVTFISFIIGFPVAYYLAFNMKNAALRTLLLLVLLIPFWIDLTTKLVAWYPILGHYGVINSGLVSLHILSSPTSALILSPTAAVIVMVQTYFLFMMIPILLTMTNIDPAVYDAAQALGANRWQTFREITLSLSLPGIIIGCVFTFVSALADFATPSIMGGTMLTTGQLIAQSFSILDFPFAAALATVVIIITMALVLFMFRFANIAKNVV